MERKKTSIFEAIVSSTRKIKLKSTLQKAIFRLYSSWGACTKGNMLLRNMQVASSPRIIRKILFLNSQCALNSNEIPVFGANL